MRANIIIHSVSGNLYIIAETLKEKLEEKGVDAKLYRVEDLDLHIEANEKSEVIEFYEDIIALPLANNRKLEKADAIILGSCSRFALPSAEMKAFLDATWPLYETKALEGKKFYGFASSSVSREDGKNAVKGLYSWARMQKLEFIPFEPYIHKDGDIMPNRPGEMLDDEMDALADAIASSLDQEET